MIDATLSGNTEILDRLNLLYFDDKKMQKFARLAGAEMVHRTEERFYNQHDLDRSPWIPSQRAIADNGKTLRDTGRLLSSLTYVPLPDGVVWGTNVEYAKAMHYGLPYRNVTPRPYMGMNDSDNAVITNIINRILEDDLSV